jgi:hypothetical protein
MNTPVASSVPTVDQLVVTLDAQAAAVRAERAAAARRPVFAYPSPTGQTRMILLLAVVLLTALGLLAGWMVWSVQRFTAAFAVRMAEETAIPALPALTTAELIDAALYARLRVAHPHHAETLAGRRIAALLAVGRADEAWAEAAASERAEGLRLGAPVQADLAAAAVAAGDRAEADRRLRLAWDAAPDADTAAHLVRIATLSAAP